MQIVEREVDCASDQARSENLHVVCEKTAITTALPFAKCDDIEARAVTISLGAWGKTAILAPIGAPMPIPTPSKFCGARGFLPHLTPPCDATD
jgi:hypothetical protein